MELMKSLSGTGEKQVLDYWKCQKKCADRGKTAKHPEIEKALADWVQESRQNGCIVTRGAICLKAFKLAKQTLTKDFKASACWCTRFMERHDFVLRQKTKIAQRLHRELDDKITSFQRFVIRHRQRNNYALACIGNMDETPITIDMPSNRTVNKIGEKTVLVKTTGHEKEKYTVALGCMADGKKLKPKVIFQRKTMPKEKFPKGILVHVHPGRWMDEDGCNLWINRVWINRSGGLRKDKSLLVWENSTYGRFCKKTLGQENTDMAINPGGLTSALQPLDVSINKPFKDTVRGFLEPVDAKWGQDLHKRGQYDSSIVSHSV